MFGPDISLRPFYCWSHRNALLVDFAVAVMGLGKRQEICCLHFGFVCLGAWLILALLHPLDLF